MEQKLNSEKIWSAKASISIPIAAFLFLNFIVFVFIFILAFIFPSVEAIMQFSSSFSFFIISILLEFVFLFLPAIYVKKFLERPTLKNRFKILGWDFQNKSTSDVILDVIWGVVFGIGSIFLVSLASIVIQLLLQFFLGISDISQYNIPTEGAESYARSADIGMLIIIIFLMFLVVAPSEEILFRGFMQQGLVRNIGKKTGIVLTAILFGAIHLITLFFFAFNSPVAFGISFTIQFFPYLVISLLLGILFNWRGENLLPVIIMHGLYNSIIFGIVFLFF